MIDAFLHQVVAAARAALVEALVGVYAMGSVALGDFDPARSDVDVAVVTAADPRPLVPRLDALELPARRLELVVYPPGSGGTFTLNYNRDRGAASTVDLDPATVPRFWFVLDLAIGHQHAVALHGPPLSDVLCVPSGDEIRRAIAESVAWYRAAGDAEASRVAGARAEHYLRTGDWVSKSAARKAGGCGIR